MKRHIKRYIVGISRSGTTDGNDPASIDYEASIVPGAALPPDGDLEPNLSLGPFQKLSLNLRGALGVRILNGPEDEDEDGVAATAGAANGADLAPQLELTKTGDTWLRYRLAAGIKASGTAALSALDFEFEGAAEPSCSTTALTRERTRSAGVVNDLSAGPR
jgi:hypothetical protein